MENSLAEWILICFNGVKVNTQMKHGKHYSVLFLSKKASWSQQRKIPISSFVWVQCYFHFYLDGVIK